MPFGWKSFVRMCVWGQRLTFADSYRACSLSRETNASRTPSSLRPLFTSQPLWGRRRPKALHHWNHHIVQPVCKWLIGLSIGSHPGDAVSSNKDQRRNEILITHKSLRSLLCDQRLWSRAPSLEEYDQILKDCITNCEKRMSGVR